MAEPGFSDIRVSSSFGLFDVLKSKGQREAERLERIQIINEKGIIRGTKVLFRGEEYTVERVWPYRGLLNLIRVISGDAVARREDVDPTKVWVTS